MPVTRPRPVAGRPSGRLLPTQYFHVVFTLPEQIAAIAYHNKAVLYDILFRATAKTLQTIAGDPQHLGAEIGFLAVLHTWGQNLLHHPHLHCLVPGGGIAPDESQWVACRTGFFLPVRVLSRLFRRLFLKQLQAAFDSGRLSFFSSLQPLQDPQAFAEYLAPIRKSQWVVYAKRPFGGPEQVLAYLGRYTHRVAISNNRLLSMQQGKVSFRWKDYRDHDQCKTMTLEASEFIRRFLLHVLPSGFQRIRHYGFLANNVRQAKLTRVASCSGYPFLSLSTPQEKPDYRDVYETLTGRSLRDCPVCHKGHMVQIMKLPTVASAPVLVDTS